MNLANHLLNHQSKENVMRKVDVIENIMVVVGVLNND